MVVRRSITRIEVRREVSGLLGGGGVLTCEITWKKLLALFASLGGWKEAYQNH